MSDLPSWERVRADLEAGLPRFVGGLTEAWAEFQEDHRDRLHKYKTRSKRNLFHDYASRHVETELEGIQGYQTQTIRRGPLFLITKDDYAIRLKHFDSNRTSRSYPTQQVLRFFGQKVEQLRLRGFGPVIGLVLGYELNAAETEIENVWIACPNGKRSNEWAERITGDMGGTVIPLMPRKPDQPDAPVRPRPVPVEGEVSDHRADDE